MGLKPPPPSFMLSPLPPPPPPPSFMLSPLPPPVFFPNIGLAPTNSWLTCLISFINIDTFTFLRPKAQKSSNINVNKACTIIYNKGFCHYVILLISGHYFFLFFCCKAYSKQIKRFQGVISVSKLAVGFKYR